jgi:hypothetical protein
MNYDQFFKKSYSTTGALEINRRARTQEKYLNQMQATWMADTRRAKVQKHAVMLAFFTRLQTDLSLTSHKLVGTPAVSQKSNL